MRRGLASFVASRGCLLVLCLSGAAYGVRTEQIGPDKPDRPTVGQPDWPKRIVEIPRHSSRVYSTEVNGNETFYFKATAAEVNGIVTAFSKAHMRDHEVVIAAERNEVKSFKDEVIDYNVSLQIVAGIVLFMAREGDANLPLEPRLTIFAGDNHSLIEKVVWPQNVTIRSEVPGLSLPKGRAKPEREVYYGKLEFADGSPSSAFVEHAHGTITLWEQQSEDGIDVGSVNNKGYFSVPLSKEEMANLHAGKTWLTATIANSTVSASKADQRIPADALARDKDQAKAVKVAGLPYYYGRILFEDGSPPVLDPLPWPGAEIRVIFPADFVHIDSEGYFKLVLTAEQLGQMKADAPRMNIVIPDLVQKGRSSARAIYPASLLSQDKAKAGVVKIPKPELPKKELVTAESKIGKPAPGFDKIKFDAFQPEQAKDKPLVVCFWDFDQRSSRQCVEALQKQKEALEKNGFVVLAIQAGSAAPDQVKDWLDKTGVTLTPGRIEGDPHDVLLAWGAKGMPWLVLTNGQHAVRLEGFSPETLQDINK
jgi:hypothetical protein